MRLYSKGVFHLEHRDNEPRVHRSSNPPLAFSASPHHHHQVTALHHQVREPLLSHGLPVIAEKRAFASCHQPQRAHAVHTYAALAFYTQGSSRLEQNGEWRIQVGDVHLIPAGQRHRRIEMQEAEFWGLGICVPCYAAHGSSSLLEPFERVRNGASAVVSIPSTRHEFLEGLFQELAEVTRERTTGDAVRSAVQTSLLTLILHEVRKAADWSTDAPAGASSVVMDSLRFIERNCLRRLTLQDVADAVGKSPAYVTTALTKATGKSAGQWIVSSRMAEARRLLLHSDEMVDVIAERVGYADPTHFIRMFRREHGTTPAVWRGSKK